MMSLDFVCILQLFFSKTKLHSISSIYRLLCKQQSKADEKEKKIMRRQEYYEYIALEYIYTNENDYKNIDDIQNIITSILKLYNALKFNLKCNWNLSRIECRTTDISVINLEKALKYIYMSKIQNKSYCGYVQKEKDYVINYISRRYHNVKMLNKEIGISNKTSLMLINNCLSKLTDYEHFLQACAQIMQYSSQYRYVFLCLKFTDEPQKILWAREFAKLKFFYVDNFIDCMKMYRLRNRIPIYKPKDFILGTYFMIPKPNNDNNEKNVVYTFKTIKYFPNEDQRYSKNRHVYAYNQWGHLNAEKKYIIKTYGRDNNFKSCKILFKGKCNNLNLILHENTSKLEVTFSNPKTQWKTSLYICTEIHGKFRILFVYTYLTGFNTIKKLTSKQKKRLKKERLKGSKYIQVSRFLYKYKKYFDTSFYNIRNCISFNVKLNIFIFYSKALQEIRSTIIQLKRNEFCSLSFIKECYDAAKKYKLLQ
ncbi:hypothetical protein COBT_002091 [Conglomerata obtusa]